MTILPAIAPTQKRQPTTKREWTYEDYLQLPDGKRFEIIYGELFEMPSPLIIHQVIVGSLFYLLRRFIEAKNLGVALIAPVDVILAGLATPIQPDVIFISNDNEGIIQPGNIKGVPDLVVEVLSPTSIRRDRVTKFGVYENAGISEYWIINPKGGTVEIYALDNDVYELAGEFAQAETIVSPLFGELDFEAKALFPQE
jgi:Uma2 family endonuclease